MINTKTDIDYNYSINSVLEDMELDIKLQNKNNTSSSIFNNNFKEIENSLNKLYENSRHLEDAIDYTRSFLDIKIRDYSKEITSTFEQINDIRDSNKESGYIEYNVLFNDYCDSSDRDLNKLKPCAIKNNKLILNNKKEINVSINSVSKKSNSVSYTDNIQDILNNKDYRSVDIEEKIISGGIVNTITLKLKEITNINYLDIKSVNSKVKNIRYVYSNGIEDEISNAVTITNNKLVAYIKFDLVCENYNASTYYLDKSKITDSTWTHIKEYDYINNLGGSYEGIIDGLIASVSNGNTNIITEDIILDKTNIVEKTMYSYMFGIDSIDIKCIEQESNSVFVSAPINLGTLDSNNYITLECKDNSDEYSSIEYYVLDGDKEIAINNTNKELILNEKIFKDLDVRFTRNESNYEVIRKNGNIVNISMDDAKTQVDGTYSIDYHTDKINKINTINNTIRIKAIIRKFNEASNTPYIDTIKIKKFGGESLWIEK